MSIRNNQQGNAHLFVIIAVVVVIIIGLVGWRVWDARKTEKPTKSAASSTAAEEPAAEVTVNYVMPTDKSYRIGLPEGWATGVCGDNGLFMAPTADELGKCQSESLGTVFVTPTDGNTGYGADYYAADPMYGGVTYTPVTIDGIKGYKVVYTVATEQMVGPSIGTKITQYVLFDGTQTYTITYQQNTGQPDLSALIQTSAETFERL